MRMLVLRARRIQSRSRMWAPKPSRTSWAEGVSAGRRRSSTRDQSREREQVQLAGQRETRGDGAGGARSLDGSATFGLHTARAVEAVRLAGPVVVDPQVGCERSTEP